MVGVPRKLVGWWRKVCSLSVGTLTCALVVLALLVVVAVQAIELHRSYPITSWGNVAEGFAAVGTLLAVVVALWQSVIVRRQSEQDAKDSAQRFQQELGAAESRHNAQLAAQQELARAQLTAQMEQARVQRVHLREQEFKLALIRVSRAVNLYTHELATLIEQGRRVAELPEKREREDALHPLSKRLGLLVKDVSLEISGAHMLTQNDRLHEALNAVNAVTIRGVEAEVEVRGPIIDEGVMPNPAPIFQFMDAIQTVLGQVRELAGNLLITGWQ
jgi:multidrug efflux pump subunit AcrA (membrane-fusion protein)